MIEEAPNGVLIETVAETGSTNADLLARIAAGDPPREGSWLQAEQQVGGRGRLGRRWVSPRGNLYCSSAVHLTRGDPEAHTLSFVTGLAVHATLRRFLSESTSIALKWPNDCLVDGAKIAGVLLERSGDVVVVGIGINVCHAPDLPDRETTSIAGKNNGDGGNPRYVLEALGEEFAEQVARWRTEPLTQTLDRWIARAHPFGAPLAVGSGDERITGTFAGLDQNGALLLSLANGALRTIHAGDVSVITKA